MKGRPPVPTKLKVLRGNPGHRPINHDEPQPPRTIPECPSHLAKDEREIWERVSHKLFDAGILTEVDDLSLSVFCEYFSEYRKLSDQTKKAGVFIKVKNGKETKTFVDEATGEKISKEVDRFIVQRSPVAAARDAAWAIASRILADFGMTPSSRARLKVELEQERTDSYEAYRGKKTRA
ncbi:phage terminase small subunit P27 family [bacterium]|nr:phage terminase small subunit P27 family [bacterium]